ncbi:MAG: undecaprenyl/decaprenyl-phosphate alpha-N-acetylglucosaminyl 1-phosphate transferase [PVC group bacterium]|nr:undecaprenyl/decaprenyl-phosphate alpha-N-acetylglucosaminyl 1-phosphate transferase [PVC group bacterium]
MNNVIAYIGIFLGAFLTSFVMTAVVRKIALKKRYLDKPSKRKVHTRQIPTLGGIALWFGFNLGMLLAFLFIPALKETFLLRFFWMSSAVFIIVMTGIYDDLHDLSAQIKLIIQILVAVILVTAGFEIDIITKPLGGSLPLGVLSLFISVLWIVGMINAINLLDGLDGLAAGVSGIAVIFLFISGVQLDITFVSVLSLCLIGAIAGFLPYNFYPAKIFMGNTGSMFLGVMLAMIAIASFQKRAAVFTLFIPVLAMAIPIMDTFLSIVRRILKKKPIFKADKEHIHHKLLVAEGSQRRVVFSLYFLTTCYGLIALSFSQLNGGYAVLGLILVVLVTIKWLKSWGFLDFK